MNGTSPVSLPDAPVQQRFLDYERDIRVKNYRLCAVLAAIFMVAGSSLDWVVYGAEGVRAFFGIRTATAVVLMICFWVLDTPLGRRRHRWVGLVMAAPIMASISWMIYAEEGAASPYYAGLNLVMLGAAVLMRWPLLDSINVVCMTLVMYLVACFAHGDIDQPRIFYNNLYFLVVTGVFTTAGTWFYNSIRLSEFQLRNRLDQSLEELESANEMLVDNNRKLRELDDLKSQFFANISHELRTPLTLLLSPLEKLLAESTQTRVAEVQPTLETMRENGMRLLRLINDLLDLVRLEAGGMTIKEVSMHLPSMLSGLVRAVAPAAEEKGQALRLSCDEGLGRVLLDLDKLERIILNLLTNAVKFTPSGGEIDLLAQREGDLIHLSVRDTGEGIAADDVGLLFERFWQADASSQRRHQGLGIGLALVRELAEVQGGRVAAESELGVGTTVHVWLPHKEGVAQTTEVPVTEMKSEEVSDWMAALKRRSELFPAQLGASKTRAKPKVLTTPLDGELPKVLVADDDKAIRDFVAGQLEGQFQVRQACDGPEAIELALEWDPDVILTDMMMPVKDGLMVCRELREKPRTRKTPVVIFTARADERTKLDCLEAGANDFLIKPFSLTELMVRIRNLAESRRYQLRLNDRNEELELVLKQLKETEEQLLRHEKMASLGRLSAGLVHEINNPLNYALQGLYLMRKTTPTLPEGEVRADFEETLSDVEEGVNRVVKIVSDLRGFTRPTFGGRDAFNLKTVVDATMRFFAYEVDGEITLDVDVPGDIELVGDGNQFSQLLVNLTQNAIDAMKTKTYPEGEKPVLRIWRELVDDHIRLHVRDNGTGIPLELRTKVFDPFFTTKEVGAGLGLGLSVCHRIVADMGGRVHLDTEEGLFTDFILELVVQES